jgi:hypothetical protein
VGAQFESRATLLRVRVYLLLECAPSISFVLRGCQASSAGFQTTPTRNTGEQGSLLLSSRVVGPSTTHGTRPPPPTGKDENYKE